MAKAIFRKINKPEKMKLEESGSREFRLYYKATSPKHATDTKMNI